MSAPDEVEQRLSGQRRDAASERDIATLSGEALLDFIRRTSRS